MFTQSEAEKIPWFARIEVVYKQPREDKKLSELAYFRGYGSEEHHPFLDLFKERLDLGAPNTSHNRGNITRVSYSEIERVIVFTPRGSINHDSGAVENLLHPEILELAQTPPKCTPTQLPSQLEADTHLRMLGMRSTGQNP